MGKTPNGKVWLCSCPELPSDYSNTYWFENLERQLDYFSTRVRHEFTKYTYLRKENAIQVNIHVDKIHECNYLYYQNDADNHGKYYFCFIVEKEYINENVTKIYIATDVIQTYWHDIELKDSYVDRMHVKRWDDELPTNEFEPEGLEYGEHVQDKYRAIHTMEDNFLAVCSNPLGIVPGRKQWSSDGKPENGGSGGGGGDLPSGSCDWRKGQMSRKAFRMLKGEEGLCKTQNSDPGGKQIIAYGITPEGERDLFNKLVALQPISEEMASLETYNVISSNKYAFAPAPGGGTMLEYFKREYHCDSQNRFDALIDLHFNAGIKWVTGSHSLLDALRTHPDDEHYVRPIWESYIVRDDLGRPQDGLLRRRKFECDLWFNTEFHPRKIEIIGGGGKYVTENNGDGFMPSCTGGGEPTGNVFTAYGYKWNYPTNGTVSSEYGIRTDPVTGQPSTMHKGIDIANTLRTPIRATRDGVVEDAGPAGTAGNWVVIYHDDIRMKTKYMHNDSVTVRTGQRVKAGELIAYMGKTGKVTGVHLHYQLEIFENGVWKAKDPILPHRAEKTPIP